MADAARLAGALYDVTNVLCKRLFAELDAGQPGTAAEVEWEALLAIASVWRDAPNVPAGLRELVAGAAREILAARCRISRSSPSSLTRALNCCFSLASAVVSAVLGTAACSA
ncbi:hypothetical protein ACFVYP_41035 [Kitasatospora sp. NPDC058201]|uniref:hypothetical protein n=1 Tax=unclassified Kitasatospora TaxID=2633591 RepID=UPI00364F4DCF